MGGFLFVVMLQNMQILRSFVAEIVRKSCGNTKKGNTMANFAAVVYKDDRKKDGTYNVKIRLHHNSRAVKIRTPFYVTDKQLTRNKRLKDQAVIDACENIMREWRGYVVELGIGASVMSAKELGEYIKRKCKDAYGFRLEFKGYIRKLADTKSVSTRHNYCVACNALDKFHPAPLDIGNISAKMLADFELWLRKCGKADGTIHIYMTLLKSAFNSARFEYNDEDRGEMRIPHNPFARYKMPTMPAPNARAIDLATLQKVAYLEDEPRVNSARNFARDVYMLSFALGGINAVDLYNLPVTAYHGEYIEYNRQKTKGARADGALYRVHIVDEVRPLIERLRDPFGRRLFGFYLRKTEGSFSRCIAQGMAHLNRDAKYKRPYVFYSARHTYATLGRNIVGLDRYTIHELLNHSATEMKITDRYIERDWGVLFDAHDKIVRLVDWSVICAEKR